VSDAAQPPSDGAEPRRPANPALRSAARAQPVPAAPEPARERIKEGAADLLLNSVAVLQEVVEDFRARDRFFKYKATALALWLLTTVGAFGVACPAQGPDNELDAQLIVTGDESRPIYMVLNDGDDSWQDVELVVNGAYRSTQTTIEKQGGTFTLSPGVLFDSAGRGAPSTLQITDITVKVREPDAAVVLLKGGVPQHLRR
jgi:hypothetical protein